jgi:hypothetical protein
MVGREAYLPGSSAVSFSLPALGTSSIIGPEIAIVPVPNVCNNFYVIYTSEKQGVFKLGYIKVDMSGFSPIVSAATDLNTNGPNVGIAVSALAGIGVKSNRILYATCAEGTDLIRSFTIKPAGIFLSTVVASTATPGLSTASSSTYELELTNAGDRLAWGFNDKVYVLSIATGAVSTKTIAASKVTGLEFDAAGTSLFVSASGGVYKMATSFAGTVLASAITPSSSLMNQTQLEMAKNGKIYGVNQLLTGNKLTSIITASNTLSTSNSLPSITNLHFTGIPDKFYTLPDQVDGEDYSNGTGVVITYGVGNTTATLSVIGAQIGTSYTWVKVGQAGVFATTASITVPVSTSISTDYTVTFTTIQGCQKTTTITVLCSGCNPNPIPRLNGYNTNDAIAVKQVNIYPNPGKTEFTVDFGTANATAAQVEVFDVMGRMVYTKIYNTEEQGTTATIPTEHLNDGIYFVRVNNGTEQKTIKWMKMD